MRKAVFAINLTADGYCGLEAEMHPDEQTYDFFTTLFRNAGVILFGRVTYQLMVPYWPEVAKTQSGSAPMNQFATAFACLDKIVFSTTLKPSEGGPRIVRSNLVEEVRALKQQPGADLFIDGLSLATQLSEHGLVDEYHLLVHPVIAGKGPHLFDAMKNKNLRLELTGCETFRSGIVALRYRKHDGDAGLTEVLKGRP